MARTAGHRELGTPLFLLNLKSYPTSLGKAAMEIASQLQAIGESLGVAVAVAPSSSLLYAMSQALSMPVLAQHVDPFPPGARTGFLIPEALVAAQVRGSLVNHSEHQVPSESVSAISRMLKEAGLTTVVCAGNLAQARALAGECQPPYLAIEPPELIGGNISVSVAKPEIVSGAVAAVREVAPHTKVLCGAGIRSGEDVRKALELGAEGILVSSAVAASKDPDGAVRELMGGFKR